MSPDIESKFIVGVLAAFLNNKPPPVVPGGLDWRWLRCIAGQNMTGPLLWHVLGAESVPAEVGVEWKESVIGLELFHERATKAALGLFTIFEEAGIAAVVLRGMALSHTVYRHMRVRPMVDVDVLISPEDRDLTQRALRQQGLEVKAILRSQLVYVVDGVVFEVHWSFMTPKRFRRAVDVSSWLGTRRPIRLSGGTLYSLSLENELLELALHSFVHHEIGTLLQLVDIGMLARTPELDWDYIKAWCAKSSVSRLTFFTIKLVDRLFDLGLSPRLARLGIEDPAWDERFFAAHVARLCGSDSRQHTITRKAQLLQVAESPGAFLRQAIRFVSLDQVRHLVQRPNVAYVTLMKRHSRSVGASVEWRRGFRRSDETSFCRPAPSDRQISSYHEYP